MGNFESTTGYIPGIIGRIAELHARYYSEHWNFGCYFEAKVATELSDFINNYNEAKDCIWSLSINENIEGSITIDGSSENQTIAHLRWFIMSDRLKGVGAGNDLMKQALSFCKQKEYERVYLWTFQGLGSARHLYEKYGFKLVEEQSGKQWGAKVTEQRFDLILADLADMSAATSLIPP
jgi:N-acetylglutamate synthase-like GNAT family acetyltransferase